MWTAARPVAGLGKRETDEQAACVHIFPDRNIQVARVARSAGHEMQSGVFDRRGARNKLERKTFLYLSGKLGDVDRPRGADFNVAVPRDVQRVVLAEAKLLAANIHVGAAA